MENKPQFCYLHKNQPLTLYCQSCSDAICQSCKDKQPHSGQFHKIVPLQEAALNRVTHYNIYVKDIIRPIQDKVGQRLQDLKSVQKFIEQNKNAILKDINVEFLNIDENLKQKSEAQILKLQTSIKYQQSYLNILDDLCYSFENTMNYPHKFLQLYKKFDENLKNLESIRLLNVDDIGLSIKLPRQISLAKRDCLLLPQYKQRNNFINKLVTQTRKKHQNDIQAKKQEIKKKEKQILAKYNDINFELVSLNKAKLCAYCSNPFSIDLSNEACAQNRNYKSPTVYPDLQIKQQFKGTKRHIWVDADLEHRKKPKIEAHQIIRNVMKKHYENSLKDIRNVKYTIQKYLFQQTTTIKKMFQKNDNEKQKRVSKVAFVYIMTKKFQINQVTTEFIAQLLSDQKGIKYEQLLDLCTTPQTMVKIYEKQQQEYQKSKPIAPVSFRPKYPF